MSGRRLRVLFFAEAVTLAHVARPYALARDLNSAEFEVFIACDPRYHGLLKEHNWAPRTLHSIDSARFLGALARGRPVYDAATLRTYVDEDRAILEELRPDVVVGDFRLSLAVSAPLAGVPYVAITNAYWSPYARQRYIVPELPMVRLLGARIAQRLFDKARPLAFALHAHPLNRIRREHGLPSLGRDLRMVYTHADRTLYADIPELVPTFDLPAHHDYLGPVLWSPDVPRPAWWDALPQDRPILYLSLGSSGPGERLPLIVDALAEMPVAVMVATAGRSRLDRHYENVYAADYLPGCEAAARSALVICNGGSPTTSQALAVGVPVLGIASNLDQYLNMSYVEAAGAGLLLRAGMITAPLLQQRVRMLLERSEYSRQARYLMERMSSYRPSARLAAHIATVA